MQDLFINSKEFNFKCPCEVFKKKKKTENDIHSLIKLHQLAILWIPSACSKNRAVVVWTVVNLKGWCPDNCLLLSSFSIISPFWHYWLHWYLLSVIFFGCRTSEPDHFRESASPCRSAGCRVHSVINTCWWTGTKPCLARTGEVSVWTVCVYGLNISECMFEPILNLSLSQFLLVYVSYGPEHDHCDDGTGGRLLWPGLSWALRHLWEAGPLQGVPRQPTCSDQDRDITLQSGEQTAAFTGDHVPLPGDFRGLKESWHPGACTQIPQPQIPSCNGGTSSSIGIAAWVQTQ